MPKFQTVPRVIDAMLFHPDAISPDEFFAWMEETGHEKCFKAVQGAEGDIGLFLETHNGPVPLSEGDWVIKGDGELYPVKDIEFHTRYQPVPNEAAS